ncbi:AMP-binding protein [Flammeovirga kamogawensis]|uniref:AMP-binding protein n=1 Tax=Flammeovirga kamogawensis TaxID=373891 RepID=A0ABX8GY51_9BACT|nr:AMP-binding protein [Flammeovirga kamogawensis]MBB6458970.1 long-subunit acyl-CoA synthetase (AMP-forming) [Flammeovirga kamogawensis]QWG08545.1 AMP-binding protein [Flammeovirga kamogawensis]TRX66836.1 AMP-binding protein [Flammeovirga kamogawensis]
MSFISVLDAFQKWEKETPNQPFLHQNINGKKVTLSYKEAGDQIRKIASGLKSIGMERGDHVAILSKNCSHWIMADIAILMAGCVSIPIYPTTDKETINQILNHSESKAIFIGKLDDYVSQKDGVTDIPKIGIEMHGMNEELGWDDLVGKNEPLQDIFKPKKEDLMTILYTSGTTGNPKGVMHSYGSVEFAVSEFEHHFDLPKNPRFFAFLSLAHIAERAAYEFIGLYLGGSIAFPESLESFPANLAEAKPHMFFAVPRIFQKFQESILKKMPQNKLNILLKIPFINNVIRKKIVSALGLQEAVSVISGAAPISPDLQEWFKTLGLDVNQGYGMSEDVCVSHMNFPGMNRIGSVGQKYAHIQTKLSGEGEVCLKSDCLTMGYFKDEAQTAALFDEDGFLKTGDLGEYDHDGYLSIVGRVKDQFKTDKGKYISPNHLELPLSDNPNIEQVCVVGTGIPQPIALIVPSEGGKDLSQDALKQSLKESLDTLNQKLPNYEKIAKVIVMKEDWTIDNGLLTPTLKLKRNNLEKIHTPFYADWFSKDEVVIFE